MGGEQLLDLRNLRGGQPAEDVAEICLRVQSSPPAADQDRINHRAAPSGLGMANEQPPPAAHCCKPDIILHQLVVDFEASVREIPRAGRRTR
jgi:hypothetical protein